MLEQTQASVCFKLGLVARMIVARTPPTASHLNYSLHYNTMARGRYVTSASDLIRKCSLLSVWRARAPARTCTQPRAERRPTGQPASRLTARLAAAAAAAGWFLASGFYF